MEQTRALNALEPFLALSKSATAPRAAANLVEQATSAANTYVFAELLQTAAIQALRNSEEYSAYLTLLEIFAWGTLADYQATKSSQQNFPNLNDQQHQKLLLLSLLPLSRSHDTLTYSALQSALSLPSPAALESLITTAIYSGLISGTLDPAKGIVNVTSVAPLRDLSTASIPMLSSTLSTWSQRCSTALAELEAQLASVKRAAAVRDKEKRRRERGLELVKGAAASSSNDENKITPPGTVGAKRGLNPFIDDDMMDIDQEGGSTARGGTRAGKRGGGGMGGLGRRLG